MDDLISKASVCEILSDIYPTDGELVVPVADVHKAYDAVLGLPSAQRWISVTERLPESGQSVLIAENDTDPDWYAAIGQYKYGRWEWRDDMHTALPPKVIAWMPLPTPFREGGEA